MAEPLVLVHGGAGTVPEQLRPRHLAGCRDAARLAGVRLAEGASAVEAACLAVQCLEDDPSFNAGTGCALDRDGRPSLDAAVMDGRDRRAGAIAAFPPFRNPIRLAQRMLEESVVMLAGEAGAEWAEGVGFERLPDEAMIVPESRAAWERFRAKGAAANWAGGTVGAVARDAEGHLAAATSTGGAMGKLPGRVGDSPILGVGTYADSEIAISATGQGEAFMRRVFALRLALAIRDGVDPGAALAAELQGLRADFRSTGGAIVLTRDSGPLADRNTRSMSHAWWSASDSGAAD